MAGWDPVETSGLPDDIDFTIAKASFGYDAAYNNGEQILLVIEASQTDEKGDPIRSLYSLGKAGAWETLDHGRTVVSQSNPPAEGFNKQSLYWKFIEAALGTPAAAVIQTRGTPDNAGIWEGLTFHMNRVDVDYGGDIGTRKVLLPTAFVGEGPKAEAPVATPASEPVVVPETPAATNGAIGLPSDTQLKALALASATHDAFLENVMAQYPQATNDADTFAKVIDANGIYAEARA